MRGTMICLGMLAGLAPVLAQAQVRLQTTLKQNSAYCSATFAPVPAMQTQVYTYFKLTDGGLVRTETSFRTSYAPEAKTAGSSEMPIKSASLAGSVGPAGGEPASLTHRLRFTAPLGSKVGVLTVRYLWNGAPVHEVAPKMSVEEARQNGLGDVSLESKLPRAVLKEGRGRLDVVIVSTLKPEPLFQLTYQVRGFGVTDWQRSTAAQPDMDATGVRIDGVLPGKCM